MTGSSADIVPMRRSVFDNYDPARIYEPHLGTVISSLQLTTNYQVAKPMS